MLFQAANGTTTFDLTLPTDVAETRISGAFVTLKCDPTDLPAGLHLTEVAHVTFSDRQRLKLMVRAHKELVAGDARNKAKFGAFLEAIVTELE